MATPDPERQKRQRQRSVAIALALGALVVIFYASIIARYVSDKHMTQIEQPKS